MPRGSVKNLKKRKAIPSGKQRQSGERTQQSDPTVPEPGDHPACPGRLRGRPAPTLIQVDLPGPCRCRSVLGGLGDREHVTRWSRELCFRSCRAEGAALVRGPQRDSAPSSHNVQVGDQLFPVMLLMAQVLLIKLQADTGRVGPGVQDRVKEDSGRGPAWSDSRGDSPE